MISSILEWLNQNAALASWIQTTGVVTAMILGLVQLRKTNDSLKASALSNEIALKCELNNLLVGINQAALADPESAGEYKGAMRIHLLRIHYFSRVFELQRASILNENETKAEIAYLKWAAGLKDFGDVWKKFREQYEESFQDWVNDKVPELKEES